MSIDIEEAIELLNREMINAEEDYAKLVAIKALEQQQKEIEDLKELVLNLWRYIEMDGTDKFYINLLKQTKKLAIIKK